MARSRRSSKNGVFINSWTLRIDKFKSLGLFGNNKKLYCFVIQPTKNARVLLEQSSNVCIIWVHVRPNLLSSNWQHNLSKTIYKIIRF